MKDYKCTNVQGKVNPIVKEALDTYQHIKCKCRKDNCWYEDYIRGIVLNKNLDGFEYVGLYGEYQEVVPMMKQEVKYRLLPPEEAIPYLIRNGWEFNRVGNLKKDGMIFYTNMFNRLGKIISSKDLLCYPPGIYEEVQKEEGDGNW